MKGKNDQKKRGHCADTILLPCANLCPGQALREFGSRLRHGSGGTVESLLGWNASQSTPCGWTGVACSRDLHVVSL